MSFTGWCRLSTYWYERPIIPPDFNWEKAGILPACAFGNANHSPNNLKKEEKNITITARTMHKMTTDMNSRFPRTRILPWSLVGWNPKNEYVMTERRNVDTPHAMKMDRVLRTIARQSILCSVLRRETWKKCGWLKNRRWSGKNWIYKVLPSSSALVMPDEVDTTDNATKHEDNG